MTKKNKQIKYENTFFIQAVYWFIFISGSVIGVYIFYLKFEEFNQTADVASALIQNQQIVQNHNGDVFGVSDDIEDTEDESPVDDTDEQVDDLVDEIEEERRAELREMLLLQIPAETDNPNFPLTFIEPTEAGVELQIDGMGFAFEKSPYLLSSISMGKHTVDFRFTDTEGISRSLAETIVVIPRPPVIDDTQIKDFVSDTKIEFTGTALPNSHVVYFVSKELTSGVVDTGSDGNWNIVITSALSSGSYGIVLFVRKDGYASNFSEEYEFSVTSSINNSAGDLIESLDYSEPFTVVEVLTSVLLEDRYIYIVCAIGFLVLMVFLLSKIFKQNRNQTDKSIEESLKRKKSKNNETDEIDETKLSLREKFLSAGHVTESDNVDKTEVKQKDIQNPSKKKPEKGKVYSKKEFLNEFGGSAKKKKTKSEAKSKTKVNKKKSPKTKDSNKIKITLTSDK